MRRVPSDSNNHIEQKDPVKEKSTRTRKPKSARGNHSPKLTSRSTSNDPVVLRFKLDKEEKMPEVGEKKEVVEYEESSSSASSNSQAKEVTVRSPSRKILRDKKFVEIKLNNIHLFRFTDKSYLDEIEKQLYELANSADDDGRKLIITFAKSNERYRNFVSALAYQAIEGRNTKFFELIRDCEPHRIFVDGINLMVKMLTDSSSTERDIQHAISVIKMLLKDGVDCNKEQAAIIGEWAKKRADQELTKLLVRDKNFVEIKLNNIHLFRFTDESYLDQIEKQLYELANSADDDGRKLIITFAKSNERYRNFVSALAYRAIEGRNTKFFELIRDCEPHRIFVDGINLMVKMLTDSSSTEKDIQHAISVIKMLLKDGVDCTDEQAAIIVDWADKLKDQDILRMLGFDS